MKVKICRGLFLFFCALIVLSCASSRPAYDQARFNAQDAVQEDRERNDTDSVKVIAAGGSFRAGEFKRSLFGEHYRDTRAIPVRMNQLDISDSGGGFMPLRVEKEKLAVSLVLQAKDKNIYRFRRVGNDPLILFPDDLRKIPEEYPEPVSSAHPYGALMIPDMAEAAGISHTDPQLVYMPYTTALGPYLQQFGGKPGMLEKSPLDNAPRRGPSGKPGNMLNTAGMYNALRQDNDNEVAQDIYLKNRLFDMFIGDYKRDESKWLWEPSGKGSGSVYRPVALGRDLLFNKFDGTIPLILSKAFPELQSFEADIESPSKLFPAAGNLDRNLLNELNRSDWQRIARQMQGDLTDEIISTAVGRMPEEVYHLSRQEIINKLKSRRSQLVAAADDYYNILAEEVRIAGSDKREFFVIERLENTTRLTVYKIITDQVHPEPLYQRTFYDSETKALDIYALDGRDSILITGSPSENKIKIRVIGGTGKDSFTNLSGGRSIYYDLLKENNAVNPGENTGLRLSGNPHVNDYDLNSFTYDQKGFIPFFDVRGDDGLFIGALYGIRHSGFRKVPAAYIQRFGGYFAPRTGAYLIRYQGEFYSLFARNSDLILQGSFNGPKYTFNYYGQGNSSQNPGDDKDYFRVRSRNLNLTAFFQYRFSKAFSAGIGPGFEYLSVEPTAGRYVSSPGFPAQDKIQPSSHYNTVRSYVHVDLVNRSLFPTKGMRWKNEMGYFHGKGQFVRLGSDLSFYITPAFSPVTAAIRVGGSHNIGNYKFFQANSLGGNTNLRGYRNNRFSGRSSLYQNTEIRFKAAYFRDYIFTGDIGLFGFFDSGRVYSDLPETDKWHKGYGPGIWLNLYNKLIFSSSYGFSPEGRYITVKSGLSF